MKDANYSYYFIVLWVCLKSEDCSENGGTTMKKAILFVCMFLCILITEYAFAHTPFCSCLDNGDGTILCEGGFFDGSSAVGVKIQVVDASGKILI